MAKYVFVTGGVVSGLGKGITSASLGRLLKQRGLKITNQKFDPYINVDPGAMSPLQHGEVFLTDDGAETDLDLGHYERFTDENLNANSNITTGKIYQRVIKKERSGDYSGKTVQVIPHITNEIKDCVYRAAKHDPDIDVVITEIGGTVGDIESTPYLEAIRQVPYDVGRENVLYVHVTLIPYIAMSGEQKTKPTQHSVKELQNVGIQPDIIVCRTEHELDSDNRRKLSLFCNVTPEAVIQNIDCKNLYEVPLLLESERFADVVCNKLNLTKRAPDLIEWQTMVSRFNELSAQDNIKRIGILGRYVELHDAYISIAEAIKHSGFKEGMNIRLEWIRSDKITDNNCAEFLSGLDGIVMPDGMGEEIADGDLVSVRFARENNIPFLGICHGMIASVVEYCVNVLGIAQEECKANKIVKYPVLELTNANSPNSENIRIGAFNTNLLSGSLASKIYGAEVISERHRHKLEINNSYRHIFSSAFTASGISQYNSYVDIVENTGCRWFTGVIFHPQYKSRPNRPHALITAFVRATL